MASGEQLKLLQEQRKEQKALLDEMLAGKTAEERILVKQDTLYKGIISKLKEINEQVKEARQEVSVQVDALIQQESKLKGLSGLQANLVDLDRTRLNLQQSLGGKQQEALNVIADLNKDIIGLSAEDSIAQELLQKQRDEKIASTI